MKTAIVVAGAVLLVIGGVWIGQGAGLIGGSFMTGQSVWLAIGVAVVLIGAGLIWWANIGYRRFP